MYAIIGDVHGCFVELCDLIEEVNKKGPREILFVGDFLDKGPDPHLVIKLLYDKKYKFVLGNHEEKHLRYEQREREGKKNFMLPAQKPKEYPDFHRHRELLNSLSFDWYEFLRTKPYYLYVDDFLVIHAGLERDKKPEEIHYKTLCRVRNLDQKTGKMVGLDQISDDTPLWTECYFGVRPVIFGHIPFKEPYSKNNTYGIDTGCCYGNKLTAILFPEREFVSVPAKNKYAEYSYSYGDE